MYKLLRQTFLRDNLSALPSSYCVQRSLIQIEKKAEKNQVADINKSWFDKYIDYLKKYERILEKNFPRTMHIYRVFGVGTKDFLADSKKFILMKKKQSIYGMDSLTREELELNYTMPKDIRKLLPVLLISAIPFTNYVILPLAYYYPKFFLTSHYWTLQQSIDFMLLEQKKQLMHNRPLFRCMQAELHTIQDKALKTKWHDIIASLGSGTHPYPKNIIACSLLFADKPYSLDALRAKHTKELLAIYGMSYWKPMKKWRLYERGMMMRQMDKAIQREGGVSCISDDALRWALSFRGLNPVNMTRDSMEHWLQQWLQVSESVDEDNISLLLHSPILLAYNHTNNWSLIYR